MNLNHVATYLAVLDTGSFHAAASQRGLSQASVSQHVRALEESQGATLIIRDRAGCHAVPGTEQFAYHARLLIRLADHTSRQLTRLTLAIGASSNIGTYLIHPVATAFARSHADDLAIQLTIATNTDIANHLTAGTLDVALMEWWDNRPGFQPLHWRNEEVVVIVGPDHPWRTRRTITTTDLATQTILGGEPHTGTGTLLRERLGPAAGDLRINMNLGNTEAVKRAVHHGFGISLVLAGAVTDEARAGQLHTLTIAGTPLHKTLWAITRSDDPDTSPSRQFTTALLASSGIERMHND